MSCMEYPQNGNGDRLALPELILIMRIYKLTKLSLFFYILGEVHFEGKSHLTKIHWALITNQQTNSKTRVKMVAVDKSWESLKIEEINFVRRIQEGWTVKFGDWRGVSYLARDNNSSKDLAEELDMVYVEKWPVDWCGGMAGHLGRRSGR